MSNRRKAMLCLYALAIMFTGFSGKVVADPGATTPIDPCHLLSRKEASTILDAVVDGARRTKEVGFTPGNKCSYYTSAPISVAGGTWGVAVEVMDAATFRREGSYFKSPAVYFDKLYSRISSTKGWKSVQGVGEAAFWQPELSELNILDGGVYIIVTVHPKLHLSGKNTEELDAKVSKAELKIATHIAHTIVLPRLHKLK